jgi:glucose-6-phosphate dehydrogenase assembly protein OpcA
MEIEHMADVTTETFFDGQGVPVDLRQIEAELARLWGPAAEQIGASERDTPHVSRIVLANLVVEALAGPCESLRGVLETVVARFPCRAIVVRGCDDPMRRIAAEVSALCHLPAPGLPQVCSERVVLRAGPGAIDLIPGAVRPVLEAELPVFLWWTSDPRSYEALFRDLADECSRLILDLPDPGAEPSALRMGLDPAICPFSRDAAWFALTRWRELIAQCFDPPCPAESLGWIEHVQIEVFSPEPLHTPRVAVWLAAWLAGQLGWQPRHAPVAVASVSGRALHAAFAGPRGPVTVEILTYPSPAVLAPDPRLISVTISLNENEGRAGMYRLSRPAPDSPAVRVECETHDSCRLPRLVEAPELDPARRIAAAIESSRVDPPFRNALPIALWLLEHSV